MGRPFSKQILGIGILCLLFGLAAHLFSADTTWVVRCRMDHPSIAARGLILKVFTSYKVVKDTPGIVIIKCMAIKPDSTGRALADTSLSRIDFDPRLAEIRFSTEKDFLPADYAAMKSKLIDGKVVKRK